MIMERLTFEGDFCDIAICQEVRGGSFCEDGYCSQRRVWERLKAYEDTGLDPEEITQLKRERDAAIEDLSGQCEYCLNEKDCVTRKGEHWNCWEWRGRRRSG